ncbi:MAG: phosphoribosylformylglycinamidine synthase subunit PurQ [Candidatus Omnitrophica bacterium]|nr:phosphoribosylformylglycinamidine synthase subunit PurQ [Candidatus Omnitrophota bacterium]MDD5237660.1 phosphoribosylformylglycinamidine synthase subunit PurQ [Candidatus Omnitrophota bacterium]
MKFGIVVFPGSNCDQDCFYVIKDVLGKPVKYIWHKDTDLAGLDCVILPGGFSYGDYLRTGAIAKFSPVLKSIVKFAGKGGTVIGICNGFQILLEAGLLPGVMLKNRDLHFICSYVYIKTENNDTRFTGLYNPGQILKIPIAHNEGNYYIDAAGLKELKDNNQIVFRYCSDAGEVNDKFNPNGALDNIAGIINRKRNVLGMMPHPERSAEKELGSKDGYFIFKSVIKYLEKTRT